MAIVQRWRRLVPTEALFHDGVSNRGHGIALVERLDRIRRLDSGDAEDEIRRELLMGEVLIVSLVLGAPYATWLRRVQPRLVSRHGQLCEAGPSDGPLHAVVLVGVRPGGLDLLDPFFPPDRQPLHIGDDDFSRCFSGIARVADG
jgi:hypothetical protein